MGRNIPQQRGDALGLAPALARVMGWEGDPAGDAARQHLPHPIGISCIPVPSLPAGTAGLARQAELLGSAARDTNFYLCNPGEKKVKEKIREEKEGQIREEKEGKIREEKEGKIWEEKEEKIREEKEGKIREEKEEKIWEEKKK